MPEECIDTHNIYVEKNGNFVSIRVNPRLYRKDIIMRAADDLMHEKDKVDAILDGDPDKEIIVKFIPRGGSKKSNEELLDIAHKFNSLLIASSGKG